MKPRRLRRFVAPFYVTFDRKLIRVMNQLTNRRSANQYFVTIYKFVSSIECKCCKVLGSNADSRILGNDFCTRRKVLSTIV